MTRYRYKLEHVTRQTDRTAQSLIRICYERDIAVHGYIAYPEYGLSYQSGDNERSAQAAWLSKTGIEKLAVALFRGSRMACKQRVAFLSDMNDTREEII